MLKKMKGDTPIKLANISEMSDEDLDAMIHNIRERRLKPVRDYEELSALKAEAIKQNLGKQLSKQLEMFEKELGRVDRALEKIEGRAIKLRALKLEIEAT
tara:strand:- start:459 stop:758 length:300 start_codon:yes stop_codon:yes gene_type:complete